ncbi:hypothetical protein [Paenibacillus sp. FJAT-27812]|uniref:hypothetical protein n=1 Tax=Paenibacillus sp. FJAT-27812 TaxID=1684143 RepID=UPI000A6571DA|nr:hypothetical protein [Paenibacillus sp. FJAT-27812]
MELIVQEQVKDLHGAWSFWAEQVVEKDASVTPPINQTKPVMTITYPTGTTAFLYIDYAGTEKSFNLMEGMINPGRVVRVQGQVYAKGAWSNMSNSRYLEQYQRLQNEVIVHIL